jgi:hypothetical protein
MSPFLLREHRYQILASNISHSGHTVATIRYWLQHRTIGEADGAVKYSSPGRAVRQLRRDALLREAGFEVVHSAWDEITRVPEQVVAALRRAFERGDTAREMSNRQSEP